MSQGEVVDVLHQVHDPEIPRISIVDLGMVGSVKDTGQNIQVSLIPTFVGCSAQRIIQEQALATLQEAFPHHSVKVTFDLDVPWHSDRITEAGRQALKESGIAPPGESLSDVLCPYCGSPQGVLENLFGSTSCKSLYYCSHCHNPFEAFKPL